MYAISVMNWTDEGIFLGGRKFGESSSIVSVFTREKGRHLGLVRGGTGRRMRPVLQMGNLLECKWSARLLSLIHISAPTRLGMLSYAVFCL